MFTMLSWFFNIIAVIIGAIVGFWFGIPIWIGSAIHSALSSRRDDRDDLLAENNRLLAELLEEKRRNQSWKD